MPTIALKRKANTTGMALCFCFLHLESLQICAPGGPRALQRLCSVIVSVVVREKSDLSATMIRDLYMFSCANLGRRNLGPFL